MSKADQAQLLKGFKDIIIANKEYIIGLIAENMDVSDILDNVMEDRDPMEVFEGVQNWLDDEQSNGLEQMAMRDDCALDDAVDDEDEHKLNVRCER